MKYLCLVYFEESKLHNVPESPEDEECVAYDGKLRERGDVIASEALEPVETATTVRVRDGRASVTDGPFAETKEQGTSGLFLHGSRCWLSVSPARRRVRDSSSSYDRIRQRRRRNAEAQPGGTGLCARMSALLDRSRTAAGTPRSSRLALRAQWRLRDRGEIDRRFPGGFYLVEARDLDQAIQVAAGIPAARIGSVEIRPIRQLPNRT